MLDQRIRRWPNVNPALGRRRVFVGAKWSAPNTRVLCEHFSTAFVVSCGQLRDPGHTIRCFNDRPTSQTQARLFRDTKTTARPRTPVNRASMAWSSLCYMALAYRGSRRRVAALARWGLVRHGEAPARHGEARWRRFNNHINSYTIRPVIKLWHYVYRWGPVERVLCAGRDSLFTSLT